MPTIAVAKPNRMFLRAWHPASAFSRRVLEGGMGGKDGGQNAEDEHQGNCAVVRGRRQGD